MAFSTLVLEITLTRILSVCTWYYLAFFSVSTAMLGLTAGAVTVYLKPGAFSPSRLEPVCAAACMAYALSVPLPLYILCRVPLEPAMNLLSPASMKFLQAVFACSLPFYFSGIVISALLTKTDLPVHRLYGADLIGAAAGCLAVLGLLEILSGPQVLLAAGLVGIPCVFILGSEQRAWKHPVWIAFTVAAILLAGLAQGLRPEYVKGQRENSKEMMMEKWNSFSRVTVRHGIERDAHFWGMSPALEKVPQAYQHLLQIDGAAGTIMYRAQKPEQIDFLRYELPNTAHYLRPDGRTLVIGVGGGKDIQSALLFGAEKVTGVDVNPIFINLLKKDLRDVTGLADNPKVEFVIDEARSYLARSRKKFDVIQMSLIDTWAATGAGAMTLSENGLYTAEAWQLFLNRLSPRGIFTVSRYYVKQMNVETGRIMSVAVAALLRSGITDYRSHLAMLSTGHFSVLLMSPQPFGAEDLALLEKTARDLKYDILVFPGRETQDSVLKQVLSVSREEDLKKIAENLPFDISPATDDRPYFFNMLRLRSIFSHLRQGGTITGNQRAATTLVQLLAALTVFCVLTVVLPLLKLRGPAGRVSAAGIFYFSLIGAGFMLAEIGLVQHLSVFLGHPVYALGILLFTMIASAGCGSLLSERLPLRSLKLLPLVAALLILGVRAVSVFLMRSMEASSMPLKIAASILMIFPLGTLLGFFFPAGIKLARLHSGTEVPWYWALNGIFSVLCSALAVFVSLYWGISMNFYLAAGCYLLLGPAAAAFSVPEPEKSLLQKSARISV